MIEQTLSKQFIASMPSKTLKHLDRSRPPRVPSLKANSVKARRSRGDGKLNREGTKRLGEKRTRQGMPLTRQGLAELLNEDLAREYQAIIAYVVYSQVLKGASYMDIAKELEKHAAEELSHALQISKQIDYLGATPTVVPKPVKLSDKAVDLLKFDLDNERETVAHYRTRIRQAETLGEFALSETLREIIAQEQEHEIDLCNALGIDVPEPKKI